MYRDNTVKKIEEIQYLLAQGKTRPEVAEELGYSNVTVLYHFASRNRLKWNDKKKNYDAIGNDGELIESVKPAEHVPTGKVANIISMFEYGMNGKDIAKKLRFTVQQMADYMRREGYIWDNDKNNYVHQPQEITPKSQETEEADVNIDIDMDGAEAKKAQTIGSDKQMGDYIGILEFLKTHEGKLKQIINADEQVSILPKYTISGCMTTKSFNMVNELDQVVKDYCRENNIRQQDFIQTALISTLKNYGYSDEVKARLKI